LNHNEAKLKIVGHHWQCWMDGLMNVCWSL